MDYEAARERVKKKIDEKCLLRNVDLPGKSGDRYGWMFYMRPGLYDPEFMRDVGEMFLHRVREEIGHTDFQICGMETGAVPLLVGLSMVANLEGLSLNAFSVRKEPKEYGLKNRLEGKPTGQKAIIVDDIVNSTESLRKCLNIIGEEGVEFSGWVFSIIRMRNPHYVPSIHMPQETKYIHLLEPSDLGI